MAVYFLQSEDTGFVKIGYSANPFVRVRDLRTAHGGNLKLLGIIPGTQADERQLHSRFSADRVRGEWFKPSLALYAEASIGGRQAAEGEPSQDGSQTPRDPKVRELRPAPPQLIEEVATLQRLIQQTAKERIQDRGWSELVRLSQLARWPVNWLARFAAGKPIDPPLGTALVLAKEFNDPAINDSLRRIREIFVQLDDSRDRLPAMLITGVASAVSALTLAQKAGFDLSLPGLAEDLIESLDKQIRAAHEAIEFLRVLTRDIA